MSFDLEVLITGIIIFLARVTDVTMGTLRTIAIVQGRTTIAFCLGFFEVSIWLIVISTVVDKLTSCPILGLFYAFGFATGNVVGIVIEKWIAFGHVVLRVISGRNAPAMTSRIREEGFGVTTFAGHGSSGPVTELYVVCHRRDLKRLVGIVKSVEPDVFYMTEQAGDVSKLYRPSAHHFTGWRAVFKRK